MMPAPGFARRSMKFIDNVNDRIDAHKAEERNKAKTA